MNWSKNKENKLAKLYPHNSDEDIAKIMKISVSFVQKIASELGLEKSDPAKREWTEEEIIFLKMNYPNKSNEFISNSLQVPKWQIEHRAYRLGLRKSKAYMQVENDDLDLVDKWSKEWSSEMGCSRGHYLTGKILRHIFPYQRIVEEEPIGRLWIDWLIPQLNISVEVHGIQHSKQSDFYHKTKMDFAKGQENDWQKSEMLESMNISLIVIYHDENLTINLMKKKLEEIV